jgi:O-antigen ligase/tetratricopeptide (TPR) repeat protein
MMMASIPSAAFRPRATRVVRGVMEAVLLALVCLSPWVYGAVHPAFTFLLYAGVALLLLLWAVRLLLDGELTWKKCPVALCLAGLFLSAGWQLTPLPPGVLARLASGTAELYQKLLPATPEVLPFGEKRDAVTPPPGSTLSLYPAATRQELLKLLAVFLVFVVVRNNLTSAASLRRLATMVLVNGVLLSLFALVQFFTSPHNMLYWTYPSLGQVFGPFINRNHFAFYMNLVTGLALGLLLSRLAASGHDPPVGLLHDPPALWLSASLALLLGATVVSLSRGGVLALAVGGALALAARPLPLLSAHWPRAVLVAGVLALGIVAWFGFDQVEARFTSVWQDQGLAEARFPLWARCVRLAGRFPVWGTGLGTFVHVEPLARTAVEEVTFTHAENEYVEAVVEGGAVRLLLSLAAVVVVFRLGWRALRRTRDERDRALVVGLLLAFTTLVVHSAGDFGLHVPAIALLAAVVCAHLAALGAGEETNGQYTLRLGGLAPVLGAVTAVVLGVVLVFGGWKEHAVQQLRTSAFRAGEAAADGRVEEVVRLEAAARLAPDLADLQAELAQARLDAFEEEAGEVQREGRLLEVARVTGSLAPAGAAAGPAAAALSLAPAGLGLSALRPAAVAREKEIVQRQLVPALRHFLRARDLCPLLPQAQVRLAANVRVLARADTRLAYLERTRLLAPADPWLWYLCGAQELAEGHREPACRDWSRSLELSDRYLALIVDQGSRVLGADVVTAQVLPDRPAQLVTAAFHLYPGSAGTVQRRPLLERARRLLGEPAAPVKAEDFHVKALVCVALGQRADAGSAYQAALARDPGQVGWRVEYAQLLYEERRFQDARHQLQAALAQQPGNTQARELLDKVARSIAETM